MPSDTGSANREKLEQLIEKAVKCGADAADTVMINSVSLSVARRFGKPETLERSESGDIGLRAFIGKKQAIVSTTDKKSETLDEMAERAVAMAREVPDDEWCGVADPGQIAKGWQDLDICDRAEPKIEEMTDAADRAEAAALAVKGVTNSEGAEFSWGSSEIHYAASNGFYGAYETSGCSLSTSVLVGEGTAMERDYDYDMACYAEDLRDAEDIGRTAAERAVKMLGAKKGKTKTLPVVFDPRVGNGLLQALAGAISGSSVARGTSMLKNRMGEQIFAENITVTEDPFMKRGLRSKPFDAEGILPSKRNIVENGVLQGWLLDLGSARQLGLETTGNASRGTTSTPSPKATNFFMQPGDKTPEELIGEIEEGFYVTSMMGSGVSIVTGDYSRGASGFWIEQGRIAFPVNEMTVAGNLKDMWMRLTAANDLAFEYGVDVPTLRVDGMTVAGS